MNYAIVFAGGVGRRMQNGSLPKQFLELNGKPIIIHTLDKFEQSPLIDAIVVVCVSGWETYLQKKVDFFGLKKVVAILTGGKTAEASQFVGLDYVKANLAVDKSTIVLLHDGVRPLIDQELIKNNILCVKKYGSAITVVPAIETVGLSEKPGTLARFVDRSKCVLARAPQSYLFNNIFSARLKASADQKNNFIDSATMMQYYGYSLHTVEGSPSNIKITTPTDFFVFKALVDAQETQQIFGGQ